MAIFTLTEIEEQIAAAKSALLKIATGKIKQYSVSVGGSDYNTTYHTAEEIQGLLEWLQKERIKIQGKHKAVTVIGRTPR